MSHFPEDQAVEKRRKVLKGALAASGVATMGYSGSALASFNCLEKTATPAPINGGQLVYGTNPETPSTWRWVQVAVYPDGGNGSGKFNYLGYAYSVGLSKSGSVWAATSDPVQLGPAQILTGNSETFYLLVLYDNSGQPVAPLTYAAGPAASAGAPAVMPQPAFNSCLSSLVTATTSGTSSGG